MAQVERILTKFGHDIKHNKTFYVKNLTDLVVKKVKGQYVHQVSKSRVSQQQLYE